MALLSMAACPGVSVLLEYANNNGRLTGLTVDNATGASFVASVSLSDGRNFGRTFDPGVTALPIAGGAGTKIVIDAQGEATITGIASVSFGSA